VGHFFILHLQMQSMWDIFSRPSPPNTKYLRHFFLLNLQIQSMWDISYILHL
jgi:hypothetical protein